VQSGRGHRPQAAMMIQGVQESHNSSVAMVAMMAMVAMVAMGERSKWEVKRGPTS
jgi:hypothetical protein